MNKKVIIGLTMLLLLSLGAVGTFTWTYFTDTETSTGNYFQAGTMDLIVDGENPWASTAITLSPMYPGGPGTSTAITLSGSGNMTNADLYYRIYNVGTSGGTITEPECSAEGNGTWTEATGTCGGTWTPDDDVHDAITVSFDWNGVPQWSGTLSAAPALGTWTSLETDFIGSGANPADFVFSGTLAGTAGNEYQGDQVTFDIQFGLAQDGQTPS